MDLTVDQALQQGIAAIKEGKLQDAERLYRAILEAQPNHPDANHNLGVLAVAAGKPAEAVPLFKLALEANPKAEQFWLSYTDALIKLERFDDARKALGDAENSGVTTEKLEALKEQLRLQSSSDGETLQYRSDLNSPNYLANLSPAIELREAGRYKEAQEWLNNFILHNPANPEALSLLSQVFLLDKNEAEAEKALSAAISINSELASVYRNQARLLLKRSRAAKALEKAQLACKQFSNDEESLLILAVCLRANKRDSEALSIVEKILKVNSSYAEAYANRALIKFQSQDMSGAIEDAEKAVLLKPHLTQMWSLLGSLYYQAEDLTSAIEALRAAIKGDPENTASMVKLGECLRQYRENSEAISVLEKATALSPKNASAWSNLGLALQQDKRNGDAKIAYEKALALDPDSANVLNNLGALARESEDWEAALGYFEKAVEVNPNLAEVHGNLGATLQTLDRPEEAEVSHRRALALQPNYAEAHYNLGITLQGLGKIRQAEASYREALGFNPNFAEAHSSLGAVLQNQRRFEEAEANHRQAIALKPKYAKAHHDLGLVLHSLGNLDGAANAFRTSCHLNPASYMSLFHLHATYYRGANTDFEAAINCLSEAQQIVKTDGLISFFLGMLLDYEGHAEKSKQCFSICQSDTAEHAARLDSWSWIKSNSSTYPLLFWRKFDCLDYAFESALTSGLILEFGVAHGESIRRLASKTDQIIHGFDSFKGLPESWAHLPKGAFDRGGEVPSAPATVQFHVGWFEQTLPSFLIENKQPIKFLNIDCDLYSSAKTVFDLVADRVVSGTIIFFDEYCGFEDWRNHEFKAFQEAVERNGWKYDYLAMNIHGYNVVVRIR